MWTAQKCGWFSEPVFERSGHASVWQTPEGGEVTVTGVSPCTSFPEQAQSQFRGMVTKWLRDVPSAWRPLGFDPYAGVSTQAYYASGYQPSAKRREERIERNMAVSRAVRKLEDALERLIRVMFTHPEAYDDLKAARQRVETDRALLYETLAALNEAVEAGSDVHTARTAFYEAIANATIGADSIKKVALSYGR